MRDKRRIWVQEGKPRGNSFDSYKQYKMAKCAFRKYHRSCAEKISGTLNEVIDNAAEVDNDYFWKIVNRRRNSHGSLVCSEMKFGDTTYRDPEEICIELGQYYSVLYSELSDATFDEQHCNNIKTQIEVLKTRSLDKRSGPLFNEHELSSEITKLAKRKACGADMINNEHIILGGSKLLRHLTLELVYSGQKVFKNLHFHTAL